MGDAIAILIMVAGFVFAWVFVPCQIARYCQEIMRWDWDYRLAADLHEQVATEQRSEYVRGRGAVIDVEARVVPEGPLLLKEKA